MSLVDWQITDRYAELAAKFWSECGSVVSEITPTRTNVVPFTKRKRGVRPSNHRPVTGGQLHRFPSDKAIQSFCDQNYLSSAVIEPSGRVTAYEDYRGMRHHIGWVL